MTQDPNSQPPNSKAPTDVKLPAEVLAISTVEAGAPVQAPAQANAQSESSTKKTILTVVEGVILGLLAFAFGNYYLNLSRSSSVKWQRLQNECLNLPICDTVRVQTRSYKLGGNAEVEARMLYAVDDPKKNQIITALVQQHQVSLLNYLVTPKSDRAIGQFASLPADDPEINPKTAVDFTVNQLEPGQAYELILIIHSTSAGYDPQGRFEIRNSANQKIDYEGLVGSDYLRLYLVEAIVLSTLMFLTLAVVMIGITWRGGAFVPLVLSSLQRK